MMVLQGALAGKCKNNRTRGRSRKRAELIVYCFRRSQLWGSNLKLHAGYSITLRFYLEGSAVWEIEIPKDVRNSKVRKQDMFRRDSSQH